MDMDMMLVISKYLNAAPHFLRRWFLPNMAYQHVPKPINLGEMLTLIVSVHAHQILVDGAFNGDPHPGNIMLLEDGRVGLIDFGQVKIIDENVRLNIGKMILAIENDDREEIVRLQKEGKLALVVKSRHSDLLSPLGSESMYAQATLSIAISAFFNFW